MSKAISFQYDFIIPRDKDGHFIVSSIANLSELSFNLDTYFRSYLGRKEPYFQMDIWDYGFEGLPVISVNLLRGEATSSDARFQLEVTAVPSKLNEIHRKNLEIALEKTINDDNLKIWWDNDPRGARKRSLEDKKKILETIKEMPIYDGFSDATLEDIEITVQDALEFFGFNKSAKPKDLKKIFKAKFREFQLKYHPDSETGNQNSFMYLQSCREVLEKWLKRG